MTEFSQHLLGLLENQVQCSRLADWRLIELKTLLMHLSHPIRRMARSLSVGSERYGVWYAKLKASKSPGDDSKQMTGFDVIMLKFVMC